MSENLGARLREQRLRRQVDLTSIAQSTKVNAALFEALERNDLSRWPTGIFRRSFVRAYAQAIGLDPEDTLREFLQQFPEPIDPALTPQHESEPPQARRRRAHAVLRLTLADASAPYGGGRMLADIGKRCAAVALDGAVVLAIALGLFVAVGNFWMSIGLAALAYHLFATLFLGNTPGLCLLALREAGRSPRTLVLDERTGLDPAYDRGIGAIASVSGPLSSS